MIGAELIGPAMQGTGRMALYAGLHPAQLKDSVTSEMTALNPNSFTHVLSSWRMYDRRLTDHGGRTSTIHNGKSNTGGHESVGPLAGKETRRSCIQCGGSRSRDRQEVDCCATLGRQAETRMDDRCSSHVALAELIRNAGMCIAV